MACKSWDSYSGKDKIRPERPKEKTMTDKHIIVKVEANNSTKINITFKIPLREEMLNDLIMKLLNKYMDAEIEVLYDR